MHLLAHRFMRAAENPARNRVKFGKTFNHLFEGSIELGQPPALVLDFLDESRHASRTGCRERRDREYGRAHRRKTSGLPQTRIEAAREPWPVRFERRRH